MQGRFDGDLADLFLNIENIFVFRFLGVVKVPDVGGDTAFEVETVGAVGARSLVINNDPYTFGQVSLLSEVIKDDVFVEFQG